jgi:hypothetical protein
VGDPVVPGVAGLEDPAAGVHLRWRKFEARASEVRRLRTGRQSRLAFSPFRLPAIEIEAPRWLDPLRKVRITCIHYLRQPWPNSPSFGLLFLIPL